MYRFKSSKYKNATPKVPKKGEGWVLDLSVGAPQSFGNHIKASALHKVFSVDNRGGGSLGVLSLDDTGKKSKNCPLLHAHSDFITDFDFCPYDDGLLATCAHDGTVKVWRIPDDGIVPNVPQNPEIVLQPGKSRIENLSFNPTVDCLLAAAADSALQIWDLVNQTELGTNLKHDELIQSLSWRGDGNQIVSSGRDKKLRLWDPRAPGNLLDAPSHANNRDSRVLWLGDSDYILSTGLGSAREREVCLRDVRRFNSPCAKWSGDSAMGVYIPLYDPDTNMLFLAAKGDITVNFWEVSFKEPFLSEASKYMGEVQTKGAGLVPKRAMKVMEGEVNRVLILGQDCIVPVSYQVPRKSYRDFHADVFPDTLAATPSIDVTDWLAMKSAKPVPKVTLDPEKRPKEGLTRTGHRLGSGPAATAAAVSRDLEEISLVPAEYSSDDFGDEKVRQILPQKPAPAPKPAPRTKVTSSTRRGEECGGGSLVGSTNGHNGDGPVFPAAQQKVTPRVRSCMASTVSVGPAVAPRAAASAVRRNPSRNEGRGFKVRVSKYRHLNGSVGNRDTQITNLPPLCKTLPGESEGFRANTERLALPLAISGGHLAILELSKRGRLQSGVVPSLICGTSIMDFAWDPFNDRRIAIACDDGRVRVWTVAEGGLDESLTEPDYELKGHTEKVHFVKFHPTAADVLASGSHDLTIIIWNMATREAQISLQGHTDQIFSLAWNPDGVLLATLCKDQKLRVYDPRRSELPVREGLGPTGTRGARVTWVLGGTHLVTTGFNKVSERQVSLYDAKSLAAPVTTEGIDVSPAILIPFYDEDSSTLFLSGKGDSTIFAFEVSLEPPHLFPLSHYKCPGGPHQAVAFLAKVACSVAEVEFARAFRLTPSSVEPLSFRVPRLRSELFQDDLFPDTRVTWEPTLSSQEWFSGVTRLPKFVSLRPPGMDCLSEAPDVRPPAPHVPRLPQDVSLDFEGDLTLSSSVMESNREKEEQIINSMKSKIGNPHGALAQDMFEGVDPKEWDDDGDI